MLRYFFVVHNTKCWIQSVGLLVVNMPLYFGFNAVKMSLIQAKGMCAGIKRAALYQSGGTAWGEQPCQGTISEWQHWFDYALGF